MRSQQPACAHLCTVQAHEHVAARRQFEPARDSVSVARPTSPTRSPSSRQRNTLRRLARSRPAARSAATRRLRTGVSASLLKAKVPARHAGSQCTASASARQRRPARAATPTTAPQRTWEPVWRHSATTGAGRARAGGQVLAHARTRPGGAPGDRAATRRKPAGDGRRGNAATVYPEHVGVPSVGTMNRLRLLSGRAVPDAGIRTRAAQSGPSPTHA